MKQFKNVSWALLGNLIYASSQWGIITLTTRLSSPETLGKLSLALAISAPLFMFTNLNLRSAQATDISHLFSLEDYFRLRILTSVTAVSVLLLLSFFFQIQELIILVAFLRAIESLSDIIFGNFQQSLRMDYVAQCNLIKGPLALFAFAAGLELSDSLDWAVIGWIFVYLAVFIFFELPRVKKSEDLQFRQIFPFVHFNKRTEHLRNLLVMSLPLGAVLMLVSLSINIPRYLTERYIGTAELGIFSAISYFVVPVQLVLNAVGQALVPDWVAQIENKDKRLFSTLRMMFGTVFICTIFCIILAYLYGNEILVLFYGYQYSQQNQLLIWVTIAAGVSCLAVIFGYAATATRNFRALLIPYTLGTIVTAVTGMVLIPRYGLDGAGWTLITGYLACFSASGYVFISLNWLTMHSGRTDE